MTVSIAGGVLSVLLAAVVAFNDQGKRLFQITNKLERPAGLVVAGERLLVVDSQRHCVVACDLNARYLSEFGRRGSGPGEFNFPTHLAADPNGDLYVTDSMNSRVTRLDHAGQFKNQIGGIGDGPGHFRRPKGVAVDTFGHVYVIDALFDNLQIFDRDGQFLLALGGTLIFNQKIAPRTRQRIYFVSSLLILAGIFAMRWNVVIGGQLFSKSLRGFTTFKFELTGQEGWLLSGALLLLPFLLLGLFLRLFLPAQPAGSVDSPAAAPAEP